MADNIDIFFKFLEVCPYFLSFKKIETDFFQSLKVRYILIFS